MTLTDSSTTDTTRTADTESSTDTRVNPRVPAASGTGRPGLRDRWRALPPLTRRDEDADSPMGAGERLAAAGLSLLPLVSGLLARAGGAPTLGAVLLTVFMTVGFGAAFALLVPRLSRVGFVVYTGSAGLVVTTAVGYLMARTGLWHPQIAFVVVTVIIVVLLVRSVVRDVRLVRSARPGQRTASAARPAGALRDQLVTTGVSLLGTVLAAVDAAGHATLPRPSGLLGTVGPLWFVGCALIVAAFGYALARRVVTAAPVLAAGTVTILSQALMYEAPTVIAAARHIGIAEYVLGFHHLNLTGDIYQGWPGLFVGAAWIGAVTGLSGLGGLLGLATWWPVAITPLTIVAVRLLAGRFLDPKRAWLAAALFALGDALNSTYFSPQAYGFFLSIAVVALLVAPPLAVPTVAGGAGHASVDPATEQATRRQNLVRWGSALVLILAITITHQISPFMLAAALVVLVAFRLITPWWLPLLAILPSVGWALINWALISRYLNISDLGSVLANLAPPEHPVSAAPIAPVTRLAFYIPAAALVVFGLIALVTVLRRRDRLHWGLALTFASPTALAVATNYGQEGIFRIVLFALPWLGVLVALALPRHHTDRADADPARSAAPARVRGRAAALLLPALVGAFAVMTAVNSYGQSGLDWARILRPGDAQVTSQFERIAPFGSALYSLGTKNATPARITDRYDQVDYTSRTRLGGFPNETGAGYDPVADLNQITFTLSDTAIRGNVYLYMSDAIGGYDDRYGLQRYSDYQRLRAAVADSPYWVKVGGSDTAQLYELKRDAESGQ